jgi:hypothetical protein
MMQCARFGAPRELFGETFLHLRETSSYTSGLLLEANQAARLKRRDCVPQTPR